MAASSGQWWNGYHHLTCGLIPTTLPAALIALKQSSRFNLLLNSIRHEPKSPCTSTVLPASRVMDLTATTGLRSLARSLARRGISLHLAELRDDLREDLQARGAEVDLGTLVSHRTVEQTVAAATRSTS